MAYEIIINKRFQNKVKKLLSYIDLKWGNLAADKVEIQLYRSLEKLQANPFLGSLQGRQKVRSIIFSKQQRIYYRIQKDTLIIMNLFDMRINPKRNPYGKQ